MHATKAPLQACIRGSFSAGRSEYLSLGHVASRNKEARRLRYEALDPEKRWQPKVGYAYLTDESGLELRRITPGREYLES